MHYERGYQVSHKFYLQRKVGRNAEVIHLFEPGILCHFRVIVHEKNQQAPLLLCPVYILLIRICTYSSHAFLFFQSKSLLSFNSVAAPHIKERPYRSLKYGDGSKSQWRTENVLTAWSLRKIVSFTARHSDSSPSAYFEQFCGGHSTLTARHCDCVMSP